MAANKVTGGKVVFTLKPPYPVSTSLWPTLSPSLEASIIDLLIPLLEPVGHYRKNLSSNPAGQRIKKRKRKRKGPSTLANEEPSHTRIKAQGLQCEIYGHLLLGFNSTVRHLETLSNNNRRKAGGTAMREGGDDDVEGSAKPLCAVFVCRDSLPELIVNNLPFLVATASSPLPSKTKIRLIPLTTASASLVAQTVQQPKLAVLGLLSGYEAATDLERFVVNHTDSISLPWLDDASLSNYRPVHVQANEVMVQTSTVTTRAGNHKT